MSTYDLEVSFPFDLGHLEKQTSVHVHKYLR